MRVEGQQMGSITLTLSGASLFDRLVKDIEQRLMLSSTFALKMEHTGALISMEGSGKTYLREMFPEDHVRLIVFFPEPPPAVGELVTDTPSRSMSSLALFPFNSGLTETSPQHQAPQPPPPPPPLDQPKPPEEEHGIPGLCGFRNVGNTCYLNAGLQCLVHCEVMQDFFRGWANDASKAFASAFAEVMLAVATGVPRVNPLQGLRALLQHPQLFTAGLQHDSHELLTHILDRLHEELKSSDPSRNALALSSSGMQDDDLARHSWRGHLEHGDSFVVRCFQGLLKSTLRCPDCGCASTKFDPYMTLGLPIPAPAPVFWRVLFYPALPLMTDAGDLDAGPPLYEYWQEIPFGFTVGALRERLATACGVPHAESLSVRVVTSVSRSSSPTTRLLLSSTVLSSLAMGPHETLIVYDLAVPHVEPNDVHTFDVEVAHITQDEQRVLFTSFGLPLVLRFKKGEILYDGVVKAIVQQTSSWFEQDDHDDVELYGEEEEEVPLGVPLRFHRMERRPAPLTLDRVCTLFERAQGRGLQFLSRGRLASPMGGRLLLYAMWEKRFVAQRFRRERVVARPLTHLYPACGLPTEAPPVAPPPQCTLMDCFARLQQEETLSRADMWKCRRCNEPKEAKKDITIWTLPDVLVLTLKRFEILGAARRKLETPVLFSPDEVLDLSGVVKGQGEQEGARYRLISVVKHYGSLSSGHYVACALVNGEWYEFNDENVWRVHDVGKAIGSSAPYVLFYQRIKPAADAESVPKRHKAEQAEQVPEEALE